MDRVNRKDRKKRLFLRGLAALLAMTLLFTASGFQILAQEGQLEQAETYKDLPQETAVNETELLNEKMTEAETRAAAESVTESDSEATAEPRQESATESEAGPKPETESETEAESKQETESGTEAELKQETESETEAELKQETESGTEAESKQETGSGTEAEPKQETESETEAELKQETESETEAELKQETESETETESEPETEAKPKTGFTYEDSRIKITASASPAANLPQNAELKADYMAEGSAGYCAAVSAVEGQMGRADMEFLDFVCYDVYFEADGKRIEPEAGKVKVSMRYKQPEFGEVADRADEYATYHIDGQTNTVEDVTGSIRTNENGEVLSVGFSTAGFSPIVTVAVAYAEGKGVPYSQFGLGSWGTNRFRVTPKGEEERDAYCLEAPENTPDFGDFPEASDGITFEDVNGDQESFENLQKILNYGFGGPDDVTDAYFTETLMPIIEQYYRDGALTDEQYQNIQSNKEDFLYVLTHIAASKAYYMYCGYSEEDASRYAFGMDESNQDTDDRTSAMGQELSMNLYDYLTGYGLKLTYGSEKKPVTEDGVTVAVGDESVFELSGTPEPGSEKITLEIPYGLKCSVDQAGYVNGPVTVAVYPGQTFRFAAADVMETEDASLGTSWESGPIAGTEQTLSGLLFMDGGEGTQDIGAASQTSSTRGKVKFRLTWSVGSFRIQKTDDAEKPVADVKFAVYRGEAYLGEVKTDENGIANGKIPYTGMDNNVITLVETSAPEGYIVNPEPITVTLDETLQTVKVINTHQETETETERETEKSTETETERETQKSTETETERETQKSTETETERETQKSTETETERETQKGTETEKETQKSTETERETEKESKTETETESGTDDKSGGKEAAETGDHVPIEVFAGLLAASAIIFLTLGIIIGRKKKA